MRRTIFNRNSTLQLIVQISSGNVNSSVRARAKTHGRTPVLIELPRGRHLAQMPAFPKPRRLHHLGSNARIYIAQECTTRGSRCLHLLVQEHNSRHARPKDAQVVLLWRASKKMPASSSSYVRGKIRAPPPRRAHRDARATSYARQKHTRVGLF